MYTTTITTTVLLFFYHHQLAFIEHVIQENTNRESRFDGGDINLDERFTFDEVEKAVGRSKSGKAPELDGIMNECF